MKLCEKLEAHDKGFRLIYLHKCAKVEISTIYMYAAGPRNEVQWNKRSLIIKLCRLPGKGSLLFSLAMKY